MDYIKIIIINLIFIISLFTFCCSVNVLTFKLLEKPSSIKYYNISNIWYTLFCSFSYISFFIIFLYCLRIYNFSNFVDLKIIFKNIKILNELSQNLSWIFKFSIITISGLLLINTIILICLLHKYCNYQIFKLYLFFKFNTTERNYTILNLSPFIFPYDCDLLSYFLQKSIHYIDKRLYFYVNNLSWTRNTNVFSSSDYKSYQQSNDFYINYLRKRSKYYYLNMVYSLINNKYYKKFIIFSPILLVLYDCIFNNLIIIHVYYYLLFYVPLMLYRRITIRSCTENTDISCLVWDILYKEETCIYALPLDHKKLFDVYISNEIRTVPFPGVAEMDLHVSMYISYICKFEYESEEDSYKNSENMEIHKALDNLVINDKVKVLIWENGEERYEDWYIIAIKKLNDI